MSEIYKDEVSVNDAICETADQLQEIAKLMACNHDKENSEALETAAKILFACSEMFTLSWDDIEVASRIAQDRYNNEIGEE